MNHIKLKTSLFVLYVIICAVSFSCKSSNTEMQQNEQAAVTDTVEPTDINESKEDLTTVDYKQFYDELAPHGEWIEVTAEDLKSDEEPTSAGEESDELNQILKDRSSSFPKVTFGQLFGVNDAVAVDVNAGAFFVWRPDPSMAVSISAGAPIAAEDPAVVVPSPVYRPYTNGQWIATNEGWYFKAPTAHEEIVHHYGRWAHSPVMGWVWVPGRVRSPAWVDWREDNDNIAWTPVPPEVYVVNNVIAPVPVYESRYVVVEKRYFAEPVITQYVYVDKVKVKGMKKLKGIYVQDRVIYNQGPQYVEIERYTGRTIAPYQVVTMNNDFRNTWIENNRINTFAPVFKKVKGKKDRNVMVTQPEKFNKFVEVWNRENRNNSAGNNKTEDIGKLKELHKDSKQLKQNKNEDRKKFFDDSDMKTGKKSKDNREKINPPKRDEKPKKEFKNKEDRPKKEVKEKRDNSPKHEKRDKSPDKPKKEKKDSKSSGNDGHKEKRDKKNR